MKMSKDKRDQFLFSASEQAVDPSFGKLRERKKVLFLLIMLMGCACVCMLWIKRKLTLAQVKAA